MKSIPKVLLLPLLVCLVSSVFFNIAPAQAREPFSVQINVSEYDIIFLTDFFDVKTDKLSSMTSGFSVTITGPRVAAGIYLTVKVSVQLRGGNGDAGNDLLVDGCTKDIIPFDGSLTLSAHDFAQGGKVSANVNRCKYLENKPLKKKIRDLALTTSTAPPGTYQIMIKVVRLDGVPSNEGSSSKTMNITFATPKEMFVEINEPKTGDCFYNLAPTFSWTSVEPNVIVRVYEAGLNHRSPQDARTGSNLCLEQHVNGATTLTYPSTAKRQLQEDRAYVVQVEAPISTSRGEQGNLSQPVVFRITNDRLGKILDNFMNSVPGASASAYSALRAEPTNWIPWPLYGNITLDNAFLSEGDLQKMLNELAAQQDIKIELGIENQ
jgi:hypothetical protein